MLILNRQGVRFEGPDFRRGPVPWEDISSAKYGWVLGKFHVKSSDGQTILKYHYERLGSPWVARRCAAEINRLKQCYSAAPCILEEPQR